MLVSGRVSFLHQYGTVLVEVAPPFFHNLARAQVIDELAKLAGVEAQVKDGVSFLVGFFGGIKRWSTLSP